MTKNHEIAIQVNGLWIEKFTLAHTNTFEMWAVCISMTVSISVSMDCPSLSTSTLSRSLFFTVVSMCPSLHINLQCKYLFAVWIRKILIKMKAADSIKIQNVPPKFNEMEKGEIFCPKTHRILPCFWFHSIKTFPVPFHIQFFCSSSSCRWFIQANKKSKLDESANQCERF